MDQDDGRSGTNWTFFCCFCTASAWELQIDIGSRVRCIYQ